MDEVDWLVDCTQAEIDLMRQRTRERAGRESTCTDPCLSAGVRCPPRVEGLEAAAAESTQAPPLPPCTYNNTQITLTSD